MSIKSKIQALITAANTTTGESDTTLTDAVQTLVDGYGQGGGGGSLPSSISKIDGGSFTLATDTKCNTYDIQTSLGESAKSFIVWTDDLTSFTTFANKALTFSCVHLVNFESASGTTRYGMNFYQQRNANGSTYNGVYQMAYSDEPAKFSNGTRIKVYMTDTFYVANKTYKWVAWA